jgi:hypothetical protein
MDVFELDRALVEDYSTFARSFTSIKSEDIKDSLKESPVLVVVAAISSMMVARSVSGRPRQFCVMRQNAVLRALREQCRISIRFGGRLQMQTD